MIIKTNSTSETYAVGERLGILAQPGDLFCVNGELGAGKTVLAKGLAHGLGIFEMITSPTFTIVNEYKGRLSFYHIDAYRINEPLEMKDLDCDEYFFGSGVTLVEWAARISEVLPPERLEIVINILPGSENEREIRFSPQGKRYSCLVEEMSIA